MTKCPHYRTHMASVNVTYCRLDQAAREALATVKAPYHVRIVLSGGAPSSYSHLTGLAGRYRGSYLATLARVLRASGVPYRRQAEGRRVVLYVGPSYAPCAPMAPMADARGLYVDDCRGNGRWTREIDFISRSCRRVA